MRTSYLATIAAASLIASAEAIKTKEDDTWWIVGDEAEAAQATEIPSAIMDDGQVAEGKAAENDAVRLAQEEAEALDAKRSAKMEAATAEAAKMVAADDAERLSGEKAVQVEASKVATDSAARISAQMETNATKHAAQATRLAALEAERAVAARKAADVVSRINAEKAIADAEADRLAEVGARIEAERAAAEAAAFFEGERLEAENAARLEEQRVAEAEAKSLEAQRVAAEQDAETKAAEQAEHIKSQAAAAAEASRIEAERLMAEQEFVRIASETAAAAALQSLQSKQADAVAEQYIDLATLFSDEKPAEEVVEGSDLMAAFAAMDTDSAKADEVSAVADMLNAAVVDEVADAEPERTPIAVRTPIAGLLAKSADVIEQADNIVEEKTSELTEKIIEEGLAEPEDAALMAEQAMFDTIEDEIVEEVAAAIEEAGEATEEAADLGKLAVAEAIVADNTITEEEGDMISTALFDLTEEEISALKKMETEIIEMETEIAADALKSDDVEVKLAAGMAIRELEAERTKIVAVETAMTNQMESSDIMEAIAEAEIEECKECDAKYAAVIQALSTQEAELIAMTDAMAESLSEIDPNTENGAEGKALLRKMYKIKGIEVEEIESAMPDTPEACVLGVAGKVIMLESLEEDVAKATSFRDFFADVYCAAYVNSLVTMDDGMTQIFPGGLDWTIEEELQRAYGPFEQDQLDVVEIAAIEAYMVAVEAGDFSDDSSVLIAAVTPLADAIKRCDPIVTDEIALAQKDREDYLYDNNFLRYLRTL